MNHSSSLKLADNIRVLAASMVEKANSGHPGGPMGGADFMAVLYSDFLNFKPGELDWHLRDRFFLDAGHMSAMLYATQCIFGAYTIDDIKDFRQWGSCTPGHPELDRKRGIENTSGPLGLGHAFGAGSAIAERFMQARFGDAVAHHSYIYISDGGIQEEISQGVGRIAGHLGLGNIIMFYDANEIQLSTEVNEVMTEDTAMKYRAWGWHVVDIDGNDHDAIRAAILESKKVSHKPSLIIGRTVMGKGVRKEDGSLFEGEVELHGKPLGKSNASYEATIEGLGAKADDPFTIFDDVKSYTDKVLRAKTEQATKKQKIYDDWANDNSKLAEKYQSFLEGKLPYIDYDAIVHKENDATRNASARVLAHYADHVENMIVASADLCNSDKTEAFLKKTGAFKRNDFSGRFLQAGVSELTMAALAIGMGLHGGIIPVCATFFAFSDYMKPAIRVAALMEQPVVFLWTHDAFRVGEDGPTHQPIEQEAQLRLLEKLKNHSGKPSLLALRPADGPETNVAWKLAIENKNSPTGLIFSRQNVLQLPDYKSNRISIAKGANKGAYVAKEAEGEPDIILIANGSEVATMVAAAKKLEGRGIKVRIVSAPSEGLFRSQEEEYQYEILPNGIPKFGLTAGLPVTMQGLVDGDGVVHGLDHFGHSAPFSVLDEKFGFTGDFVAQKVMALMQA